MSVVEKNLLLKNRNFDGQVRILCYYLLTEFLYYSQQSLDRLMDTLGALLRTENTL